MDGAGRLYGVPWEDMGIPSVREVHQAEPNMADLHRRRIKKKEKLKKHY